VGQLRRRHRPDRREFGRIEAELAKIEIHGNRTDEDITNSATSTDATGH
jgi:hypothetical protein